MIYMILPGAGAGPGKAKVIRGINNRIFAIPNIYSLYQCSVVDSTVTLHIKEVRAWLSARAGSCKHLSGLLFRQLQLLMRILKSERLSR